jgi:ATP-binding cassette, subfamily B (MDR/TAP), member 1
MSEKDLISSQLSHAPSHVVSVPTTTPTDSSDSGEMKEDDFKQRLVGLPENYREEILKQYDVPNTRVTLFAVLRYATATEKALMIVGSLLSIAYGAALPLMTIIFGNITNVFGGFTSGGSTTSSTTVTTVSEFNHQVSHFALQFVYLAIGVMAAAYLGTLFWTLSGERISRRIKGFRILSSLLTAENISRPFFVKT